MNKITIPTNIERWNLKEKYTEANLPQEIEYKGLTFILDIADLDRERKVYIEKGKEVKDYIKEYSYNFPAIVLQFGPSESLCSIATQLENYIKQSNADKQWDESLKAYKLDDNLYLRVKSVNGVSLYCNEYIFIDKEGNKLDKGYGDFSGDLEEIKESYYKLKK